MFYFPMSITRIWLLIPSIFCVCLLYYPPHTYPMLYHSSYCFDLAMASDLRPMDHQCLYNTTGLYKRGVIFILIVILHLLLCATQYKYVYMCISEYTRIIERLCYETDHPAASTSDNNYPFYFHQSL